MTALRQHIGNPLSLRCAVTTVRGITNGVNIVWKVNNTVIIERYNGNVTEEETSYVYYYNADTNLTVNDNNTVYQCQVIINSSPLISSTDNLTLNIIGKRHLYSICFAYTCKLYAFSFYSTNRSCIFIIKQCIYKYVCIIVPL